MRPAKGTDMDIRADEISKIIRDQIGSFAAMDTAGLVNAPPSSAFDDIRSANDARSRSI